jgi:hypothetical protein
MLDTTVVGIGSTLVVRFSEFRYRPLVAVLSSPLTVRFGDAGVKLIPK